MRHSSLYKVQNEDLNDKTKIKNPVEEQNLNEEINANTLMLFYHPLFQETTKKFLAAIYQKQSNDIQIKFFQFIELNLRIQKALIETFQIEKAIVSALNDWNRELTLLNVQQHQLDQNGMKPFDLKYHYDSINELQMGASFSITNFAKLLENLKEHKSFFYSEYSISIEVFQKFLFDISCNWCQFYDIEIFCFFINAIFLQITKGQDFKFCQVKSLNQISYLPQLFFKEFNQVKYVYSRYIKKNLKTNFKMWCEWNFQRLNDICQSLVTKLGRIFAQDQRTEEYSVMFKDALDNFNREIIQSASKNQVTESIENMIQQTNIENNEAYATYMKGGKVRIKFTKQQRSMSESQKIEENQIDEDEKGSADNLEQLYHSKQFMEEGSKQLNNSSSHSPDSKKQQISNGQICLNEIENKIIQKKLKQMNKLLERQNNEIDQDSSSLKAAYRQAEKSNSNAFKYFQKLLRYKKEQQKKFIKNQPYGITSKSVVQQQQEQQISEAEKNISYKQDQQNEIKNKQIIEDFYMCNQGKFNANQKFQLQDELLQQQGEFESNLKKQSQSNFYEDNFSFYEGKQRFLHSQLKKKSEQKVLQSQNQNSNQSQNLQITNHNKQQSQNTSRSVVYSSQTPPIKNQSSREFSAEKQNKQNLNLDHNIQTPHVLDLHQIALSKAHQISPSRQNESVYDKNSSVTPYRMIGYNTSQIQQQKNSQNNKLQSININSNKVNESQLNSSKVSQYSNNQNPSNFYANINNTETPKQNNESILNYEADKKQLTESKLYTTNSELDYSYIQQPRNNGRINSEQDYIFRNTSLDQKQPYNLFNKSLFNSSKNKKKISLGDIINLNYLYKPNLTFSGTQTNKNKQNDHHDLQIDIKSLKPENKFNQNTLLTERKGQGQKIRSQTVGLGEILPQTVPTNYNNDSKERQSEEKLNNSKVYLKPIQAQFTQKYRKLVSQSRYLWQKFLVEDDLYKINDYNKLNSFLDELKNTKNIDNIKQIILKYTQNTKQPIKIETSLYQFKIPYNRKAELPLMQGKNMKLTNKI
ncbi:hypothetical protein TTHERM_00500830 (macronuclear) [Tetrahymena thermophila SB210]|uniref:Uncharacterized protein n=1 Tax=Tetrahymena thermophila (strain SB210) TaxID=312017 RepID=I7M9K2_TETTS|nr:hypothetical protein TTHERM_00500830 [Tetrahymena thermophila SB210]EAS01997.1 hypothetical protein TTHERM_00500830 [Tetrahymena thermophila SB210]|eukprot:XP_001022242.1 hypothetical protein TTHERM_00500830 [Tetrahymena thermophila SB210]